MPRVAACPDVRLAILDAATLLMERLGYKKMTIDDIAREAGIGKATIYGYFLNKQEVGLAVIERYHAQIQTRLGEILAQPLSPADKLREMAIGRVMAAFDISSRYPQSVDESVAALKPIVMRRRGRYGEEEAQMLALVIEEGMNLGVFAPTDPLESARTVLTCVSGLMPYSLSPRERTERGEVIAQTNRVMDLILKGMANKEGAPRGASISRITNEAPVSKEATV
jgi:AcrR family transcriptional regulator